jgi:protocatechuate 3,4-dioxygenase alpha subunit
MSDQPTFIATGSQTVGPFFHFALTHESNGRLVDRLPAGGEEIRLRIRVVDGDGEPVGDAMIEVAQGGVFGRMPTDDTGWCQFETARPPGADGQPGRVNVCVFARGLLRQLHTRIYFAGDPLLDGDSVLALVPDHRRQTLIADRDAQGVWVFQIHLQGAQETVFFDE